MRWEEQVLRLFEDLEGQADGLFLQERDDEVAERARAGYAEIALSGRLHASLGQTLRVTLVDGSELAGTLARCGAGWILLSAPTGSWLVPEAAMTVVVGLAPGAVPEQARPVAARLGLASVLRGLAEDLPACVVLLSGRRQVEGELVRVGADFLVVQTSAGEVVLPFAAVVAVRQPST